MLQKKYTLEELATLTNSRLVGNPKYVITEVSDLESATPQDASFLSNPRYERAMQHSQAGVIFVEPSVPLIDKRNFLVTETPSQAFQILVDALHGSARPVSAFSGIHPTAIIHASSKCGQDVTIGPYVVIDQNVIIGDRTSIQAGCYIGPDTSIGSDCVLHPHVIIREQCTIGNRVILQPGAVIGSCGFGYTTNKQGVHTKLNQVGTVTIQDDVEIGANTTVDRARFKTTLIGMGTKIDNLVQIGHGVVIGEHNIIVAQTGIAGSTSTGKNVILAGQVAIAGHLKIGDGVILTARSGVSKSLPKAGKYGGAPAYPLDEYNRNTVQMRNIANYIEQIKELQKRIAAIESKSS